MLFLSLWEIVESEVNKSCYGDGVIFCVTSLFSQLIDYVWMIIVVLGINRKQTFGLYLLLASQPCQCCQYE